MDAIYWRQHCEPLRDGATAASAGALTRSRYSAYVPGLRDYLMDTWHPATRPEPLELDDTPDLRWLGLDVKRHDVDNGGGTAVFEFIARYKAGGARAVHLPEGEPFGTGG